MTTGAMTYRETPTHQPRLAASIPPAWACAVFDKGRLKEQKDRIRQISEGSSAAQATRGAIEAMEAAVAAAMIVTTT